MLDQPRPALHNLPDPEVAAWFERRTLSPGPIDATDLTARKGSIKIAAVLPARNEEKTVGAVVSAVRANLLDGSGLLDEVIVVDSHSRDSTAHVAAAAGARVVPCTAAESDGKGGAIHSGLRATNADLVIFLDADIDSFHDGYVTALVAPLIEDPELVLAKAFYDRPFRPEAARSGIDDGTSGAAGPHGGGRVTELVARPAIAEQAPALAGFAQPLAGEYAVRRNAIARLPLISGYGVDLGLLLSIWRRYGLDAMCQVDLGHRSHRHHDLDALARMAVQVRAAFPLSLTDATQVTGPHTRMGRDASGRLIHRSEQVTTRRLPPIDD